MKKKTVRIEYFDCGDESHFHKSERVAKLCLEKQRLRSSPKTCPVNKWKREWFEEIERVINSGGTIQDAACKIGATPRTAKLALARYERIKARDAAQAFKASFVGPIGPLEEMDPWNKKELFRCYGVMGNCELIEQYKLYKEALKTYKIGEIFPGIIFEFEVGQIMEKYAS